MVDRWIWTQQIVFIEEFILCAYLQTQPGDARRTRAQARWELSCDRVIDNGSNNKDSLCCDVNFCLLLWPHCAHTQYNVVTGGRKCRKTNCICKKSPKNMNRPFLVQESVVVSKSEVRMRIMKRGHALRFGGRRNGVSAENK